MINILKIFKKKEKENKRYNFIITFKGGVVQEGNCEFPNLKIACNAFLQNQISYLDNEHKGFYYNSNEILMFEIYEL
jgi:hypothetical protein